MRAKDLTNNIRGDLKAKYNYDLDYTIQKV